MSGLLIIGLTAGALIAIVLVATKRASKQMCLGDRDARDHPPEP